MKTLIFAVFNFLGLLWNLIPAFIRIQFFTCLLILESRHPSPSRGLKNIFKVEDRVRWVINDRAMAVGRGEHPKHRLTKYHQFFISKIKDGERIIDIGCSEGEVAIKIAEACPNSIVIGVDILAERIEKANSKANPNNLSFICADATENIGDIFADVLVISNVLEHIDDRILFLKNIIKNTRAKRVLLRVPHFEREWQMPMRKELSANYYSDPDHRIEHTLKEFNDETAKANIQLTEVRTTWGEIWAAGNVKS